MFQVICLVFLTVLAVSSNPIAQLACSACQPYSNQAIPSNSNSYAQTNTALIPSLPAPIGNSLNQLLLNKILLNPSLQKIIDPNTRLYNQNGEEVQRQVRNTGSPNVINNYFIVPPEFFNLNETDVENNKDKTKNGKVNKKQNKQRPKDEELALDDEEIVEKKIPVVRRKTESEAKRKKSKQRELDVIDEFDDEVNTRKQRENPKIEQQNKSKTKPRKNNSEEENDEAVDKEKEIESKRRERTRNTKSRRVLEKEIDTTKNVETVQAKMTKKDRVAKVETHNERGLKNIEKPTDIPSNADKRQTRGSKRNATKKGPEQKNIRTTPKERNIYPFPEDALKDFFPYMPMGNYYDPYSYYPYNFNQYYEHRDHGRNNNANKNKKKPKNKEREYIAPDNNKEQNRKIKAPSNHKKRNRKNGTPSNTHTIEIQLKPKKKENNTTSIEKPKEKVVTLEKVQTSKTVDSSEKVDTVDNVDNVDTPEKVETLEKNAVEEVESVVQNTEEEPKESDKLIELHTIDKSVEEITEIPMEKPHKVSFKEVEASSKESYETYSKLENLLDTPVLGEEDEVPTFNYNDIINDYYPRFDDDDYFNPDVETLDNRYFYDTENLDRKKLDRYEASRSQRDDSRQMLENPDFKTKKVRKLDYKDKEEATPEHEILKSSAEIIRVKIPPKNIRPKVENVETVFAGSKVAKYGVADSIEDISVQVEDSEESSDEIHPTYVIAKSVGRPEDYY